MCEASQIRLNSRICWLFKNSNIVKRMFSFWLAAMLLMSIKAYLGHLFSNSQQ